MPSQASPGQRILVIGLIIVGILIIVFFGIRVFYTFRTFHEPPHLPQEKVIETDVGLIRDWMTIPYISQMYGVPENVLFDALNFSRQKDYEKSLKVLNQEYYPNKNGYVLSLVKETILAHQPPPTVVPSATP